MSNTDFWISIQRLIAEGWNTTNLHILEKYGELFRTGNLLYQRFSLFEQRGFIAGGGIHVAASILAGTEITANSFTAPKGSFKRERQLAEAQATRIEEWARRNHCWIDNVDDELSKSLGEQIAEGGEAKVYDRGATLIKSIGLDYYIFPILALDRITLHNAYFPETAMAVRQFGRNGRGEFQIIVEQPFIQGYKMTDDEIRDFAIKIGFTLKNPKNWTYATQNIYLSDLHDENVIRSTENNIYVIDCDIRINTPDLKCGGTRSYTTDVISLN